MEREGDIFVQVWVETLGLVLLFSLRYNLLTWIIAYSDDGFYMAISDDDFYKTC